MLRDVVRNHLVVIHEHVADQALASALLAKKPVGSWPYLIASEPALQTCAGLHQVLDGATQELYRDAAVGLRVINAVLATQITDPVLHGRALRLRAHGLHREAEGAQARAALAAAVTILAAEPAGALELLHARLFGAYLRNEAGESDVIPEVRGIAKAFAAHGDAKGALQARVMEAAILFERDEFVWAQKVSKDALAIAEALGDERQQAIALANLGQCAQQLAQIAHEKGVMQRARLHADEAIAFFARATPLYAALGMDAESQKIVWAMAGLAKQRGNLEEARGQLARVRGDFLRRSMFLAAALVGLDLLELLVMMDRHDLVRPWFEDVLAAFAHAGMPRYALDALARVQGVAAERRIDAPLLAVVRAEVRERFARAA